jgi:hypothetical protein
MATLTVIKWRDIPAQVIVKQGRKSVKQTLSERFEKAIDRAAMKSKLHGTDDYLSQWQRCSEPCGHDLQAILAQTLTRLETEYTDSVLKKLIKAGGYSA